MVLTFKPLLTVNIACALFVVMSAIFFEGRFLFAAGMGAILSLLAAALIVYRDKSAPDFAIRKKYFLRTLIAHTVLGWTAIFIYPEGFGIAI